MVALVIVSTFVVLVLGILVAGLLRSHADILRALHDLGAGVGDPRGLRRPPPPWRSSPAPGRRARRSARRPPSPASLQRGMPGPSPWTTATTSRLLGFLSSGCTGCAAFWDRTAGAGTPAAARPHPGRDRDQGPGPRGPGRGAAKATGRVPVVMSTEAWVDYQVPGSPFFVLVDGATGRKVGQGVASHVGQLAELVRRAEHDRGHAGRHARPRRGVARRPGPRGGGRRGAGGRRHPPGRPEPVPAHPRRRLPARPVPCRPNSGHHRGPRHHGASPARLRGPDLRAPRQPSA